MVLMIQTYNDIAGQLRQFESGWNGDGQLQKIYSSSRYISLSLRSGGRTVFLFFGRGKGYEGFWIGEKQIPSFLRKKDRFLEYLRKYLPGSRLLGIEMDQDDRIIYINYQKLGKQNRLGFFYYGRKLFFANYFFDSKKGISRVFTSWKGDVDLLDGFESVFIEAGRKPQKKTSKSAAIKQIDELLEEEREDSLRRNKGKKEKFLPRKIKNIKKDLERAQSWPNLKEWVEKQRDLAKLPERTMIGDIRIRFRENTHFKRRDEVYLKIKKLKKAVDIQQGRLEQTAKESKGFVGNCERNLLETIIPVWQREDLRLKSEGELKSAGKGYRVLKFEDLEMGIGLEAKGNDQMRKLWAKKNDWWFHLDGEPGPHIIVKTSAGAVSLELLEKVALEMVKVGHLERDEVALIYTQVKNLKGVKGKPGSVNYKKEKRVKTMVARKGSSHGF